MPRAAKPSLWNLAGFGIKGLVIRVVKVAHDNEVTGYSAQLAYYFFLSLFPTLLFLTTLLAYLPIAEHHGLVTSVLGEALPKAAMQLVQDNLAALLSTHKSGLLSFGLLFALYSAGNAIIAIAAGLNRIHGAREGRPYWRIWVMALLMIMSLAVLLVVAVSLFFFGPRLIEFLAHQFGTSIPFVGLELIRWSVILFTLVTATALIYHFTPYIHQQWRWLSPGAVFAVSGWIATSELFAFYVNHFGSYNKTYGSIGAVIVLLIWMYMSGLTLLIGGSIDSVLKKGAGTMRKRQRR